MSSEELDNRCDFIRKQGKAYREKIDEFNDEFNKDLDAATIISAQLSVYAAETIDGDLKDWQQPKRYLCYDYPRSVLEKRNLYPVTKEVYEAAKRRIQELQRKSCKEKIKRDISLK